MPSAQNCPTNMQAAKKVPHNILLLYHRVGVLLFS